MATITTSDQVARLASRLRSWMKRMAGQSVLRFFLDLHPVPASRPRVSRWGTYYGKKYTMYQKEAGKQAELADGFTPVTGPVVMLIENIVKKPKSGSRDYPRGDVDNFAKSPLDTLTKAKKFWTDDDQVVGLIVWKRYAAEGETEGVQLDWFEL